MSMKAELKWFDRSSAFLLLLLSALSSVLFSQSRWLLPEGTPIAV